MNHPRLTLLGLLAGLAAVGLLARAGDDQPAAPATAPAPAPASTSPGARAICGPDKTTMALIPAGPFWMGGGKEDNEKPRHQVDVPAYYLDSTEVTFKNYLAFCAATDRRLPVPALMRKPFPEELMSHPATHIGWGDADAYCRAAGKRLPTEAEWEKACAGPANNVYPWGNGWNAGTCTNRLNSNDRTTPVGSRPGCLSGYGAYDLAGNVWEWTADWYQAYPGGPLTFDFTGLKRVAKGGAYFYSIDLLRCANRYALAPDDATEHSGFRCAVSIDAAKEICR